MPLWDAESGLFGLEAAWHAYLGVLGLEGVLDHSLPLLFLGVMELLLVSWREVLISHHGEEGQLLYSLQSLAFGGFEGGVSQLCIRLPAVKGLSLLKMLEEVVLFHRILFRCFVIFLVQPSMKLFLLLLLVKIFMIRQFVR